MVTRSLPRPSLVDRGSSTRWKRSLHGFVQTVARASFRDLRALQDAPHGSVAYGAAGLASVLLHHGALAGNQDEIALADRWVREIASRRSRSLLYAAPHALQHPPSSLWFGASGIACLRVLVAQARHEPAYLRRATESLVRHLVADEPHGDFVNGSAGKLVVVSLLGRLVRSAALREVATQLRERVLGSLPSMRASWSFAHGWPGLAFALLQDARATGRALPAELAALLREGPDAPRPDTDAPPWVRYSWCNGAAGRVLLWVSAFELLGDRDFLERARIDARTIPHQSDRFSPILCCGTAGWAYAFLALARVERGRGWDERARDIAIQIMRSDPRFTHPSGLMHGSSGVLYLATDLLLNAAGGGFPFVECLPGQGYARSNSAAPP
jgi:eukaryotic-like serine/threonine-protein kinase